MSAVGEGPRDVFRPPAKQVQSELLKAARRVAVAERRRARIFKQLAEAQDQLAAARKVLRHLVEDAAVRRGARAPLIEEAPCPSCGRKVKLRGGYPVAHKRLNTDGTSRWCPRGYVPKDDRQRRLL